MPEREAHLGDGDFGVRTRRCRICDHWLCRYNPGPCCWHHGEVDVVGGLSVIAARLRAEQLHLDRRAAA